MFSRKTALALIVLTLTFSIGFVTFKAAEIFKNLVLSSSDCSQHQSGAPCRPPREGVSGREIPLR